MPSLWRDRIRPVLARSPRVRAAGRRARDTWMQRRPTRSFSSMSPPQAVRIAYNVLLQREPDAPGYADHLREVTAGGRTLVDLVNDMRGSDEFQSRVAMTARSFGPSIHAGRCQFIRSLPRAHRVLDLGGTHSASGEGAMVMMGYPYPFDELVVVDLPPDERHPLYQKAMDHAEVMSSRGPVRNRYHSMTDLSPYDDGQFGLVYMGQSIEHVTEEEGDFVLKQVHRVLEPGGHIAIDTPNARATRLQQPEFIDPDHKVEYTHEEMTEKLTRAAFTIIDAKGLNYMGRALANGVWDPEEPARNTGLHAEIRDSYILCYIARKA